MQAGGANAARRARRGRRRDRRRRVRRVRARAASSRTSTARSTRACAQLTPRAERRTAARRPQPQRSGRDDAAALRARPRGAGAAACARIARGVPAPRAGALAARHACSPRRRTGSRRSRCCSRSGCTPRRRRSCAPRSASSASLGDAARFCPLGSAALAGSSLPLDRAAAAASWASSRRRATRSTRSATATSRSTCSRAVAARVRRRLAPERRVRDLDDAGVRLRAPRRRGLDRLELDAAEAQSRSVRTGAGAAARAPSAPTRAPSPATNGIGALVPPRPPGDQGAISARRPSAGSRRWTRSSRALGYLSFDDGRMTAAATRRLHDRDRRRRRVDRARERPRAPRTRLVGNAVRGGRRRPTAFDAARPRGAARDQRPRRLRRAARSGRRSVEAKRTAGSTQPDAGGAKRSPPAARNSSDLYGASA